MKGQIVFLQEGDFGSEFNRDFWSSLLGELQRPKELAECTGENQPIGENEDDKASGLRSGTGAWIEGAKIGCVFDERPDGTVRKRAVSFRKEEQGKVPGLRSELERCDNVEAVVLVHRATSKIISDVLPTVVPKAAIVGVPKLCSSHVVDNYTALDILHAHSLHADASILADASPARFFVDCVSHVLFGKDGLRDILVPPLPQMPFVVTGSVQASPAPNLKALLWKAFHPCVNHFRLDVHRGYNAFASIFAKGPKVNQQMVCEAFRGIEDSGLAFLEEWQARIPHAIHVRMTDVSGDYTLSHCSVNTAIRTRFEEIVRGVELPIYKHAWAHVFSRATVHHQCDYISELCDTYADIGAYLNDSFAADRVTLTFT